MLFLIAVTALGAYAPVYAPMDILSMAEVDHRTAVFDIEYPAVFVDYFNVVEKEEWSIPDADRVEPVLGYTPSASAPVRLSTSEQARLVETLARD